MSVIGEFTVPSESFLLGETLQAAPEAIVELQQIVAHSHEKLVPFFWVRHGDDAAFQEALHSDPTLEDVVLLDEFERGTSYRGTWTEQSKGVAYAYIDAGATILEATGQNKTWTLRMRFDDDAAVLDFNQYCTREQIPFELKRLYHPSQPKGGGQFGLSRSQRETLVTALQRGYYDIPRTLSMTELADELDTTQQALSERFRRAHAALIESILLVSDEEAMTSDDEPI